MHRRALALLVLVLIVAVPGISIGTTPRLFALQSGGGTPATQFAAYIDSLETRIVVLEAKVAELSASPSPAPTVVPTPTPAPTVTPTPAPTVTPAPTTAPPSGLTCNDTTGIERKFPCNPIPAGQLPVMAEFRTGTHTENFSGVVLAGKMRVKNIVTSTQADPHSTWGTGRDLPLGSTSCVAHDWRYEKPADLVQTGRNLISQLQMSGSPIFAVSSLSGNWTFVDRINGNETRATLGPIPFGRDTFWVICVKLADSAGFVRMWWSTDAWPNPNNPPTFEEFGDTWQGKTGHHTLGQYATHSTTGTYTGYFSVFGRAATPQRAIDLAR